MVVAWSTWAKLVRTLPVAADLASGASNSTMPRLVLVATACWVADTASNTSWPKGMLGRLLQHRSNHHGAGQEVGVGQIGEVGTPVHIAWLGSSRFPHAGQGSLATQCACQRVGHCVGRCVLRSGGSVEHCTSRGRQRYERGEARTGERSINACSDQRTSSGASSNTQCPASWTSRTTALGQDFAKTVRGTQE